MKPILIITALVLLVVVLIIATPPTQQNTTTRTTETHNNTKIGPYVRMAPLTGKDSSGIGFGVELAPGIHMDMGSGNLNFGF
jgi:hypothetical protein